MAGTGKRKDRTVIRRRVYAILTVYEVSFMVAGTCFIALGHAGIGIAIMLLASVCAAYLLGVFLLAGKGLKER